MGGIVQIDESLFHGKCKYNRGRLLFGNRNHDNNNGDSSINSSDDSDSSVDHTQAVNNRLWKQSNEWIKINGPLHISPIFRSICDIDS